MGGEFKKEKKLKLRRATRALCSKNKKTICGCCSIQDSGGKIGNWGGRTDDNTATIEFKKEEEERNRIYTSKVSWGEGKEKKGRAICLTTYTTDELVLTRLIYYCTRDLQSFSMGVGGDLATAAAI
jgi:hypothetical protein